jgi:hypothetical protein
MGLGMEIATQINEERNIRFHKIDGPINVDILKDTLASFYKSPDYDPDMNILWDLKDADFSSVTFEDVESLAGMIEKYWGKGEKSKAALIVSKDLGFGLSRMYELLLTGSSPNRVMVFRQYDEAEEWLEA